MTKDEALAWETVATKAVAAEQSNSGMTLEDYGTLYYPSAEAARVLAARVRELEGRTCDRCEFRIAGKDRRDGIPEDGCLLTQHEGNDDFVDCGTFGNTCGAFKEKTHAKDEA